MNAETNCVVMNTNPFPGNVEGRWESFMSKTNYWEKFSHCFVQEKVQVGKDQEKAQSEKDSHSKNRGGKKPN